MLRFTDRFIQNLLTDTPDFPVWKKIENLNANLNSLKESYETCPQWVDSLAGGITPYLARDTYFTMEKGEATDHPKALKIAAGQIIGKHTLAGKIKELPLPESLKSWVTTVTPQSEQGSLGPKKSAPGPSK